MSKLFGKFLKGSSLLALVTAPAVVFAAATTGPISVLGLQGSYNDFKLEGGQRHGRPQGPHQPLRRAFDCPPKPPLCPPKPSTPCLRCLSVQTASTAQ